MGGSRRFKYKTGGISPNEYNINGDFDKLGNKKYRRVGMMKYGREVKIIYIYFSFTQNLKMPGQNFYNNNRNPAPGNYEYGSIFGGKRGGPN